MLGAWQYPSMTAMITHDSLLSIPFAKHVRHSSDKTCDIRSSMTKDFTLTVVFMSFAANHWVIKANVVLGNSMGVVAVRPLRQLVLRHNMEPWHSPAGRNLVISLQKQLCPYLITVSPSQKRHGISRHRQPDCLFKRLHRLTTKKS